MALTATNSKRSSIGSATANPGGRLEFSARSAGRREGRPNGSSRVGFLGQICRGYALGAALAWRGRTTGRRRVVIKAPSCASRRVGSASSAHTCGMSSATVWRERVSQAAQRRCERPRQVQALTERSEGDRHQFRFIVAPERAARPLRRQTLSATRRGKLQQDLGIRLSWVAQRPSSHSYLVLRGRSDAAHDLVTTRDNTARGLWVRAGRRSSLAAGTRSQVLGCSQALGTTVGAAGTPHAKRLYGVSRTGRSITLPLMRMGSGECTLRTLEMRSFQPDRDIGGVSP